MQELDVPYFVKLRVDKDGTAPYAYQDSLAIYQAIKTKHISNPSPYFSYLANLQCATMSVDSTAIRSLVERSIQADSITFCKELIRPAYDYLLEGRPHRRYAIPYILDFDFDYFFELKKACITCCTSSMPEETLQEEYVDLYMGYIKIRDQWHRIPSRQSNRAKMLQLDAENRQLLDKLFKQRPLPSKTALRSLLFTFILHSEDCDWTERWLKKYMANYRGYKNYKDNLQHFLWRSSCTNDTYKQLIADEIAGL